MFTEKNYDHYLPHYPGCSDSVNIWWYIRFLKQKEKLPEKHLFSFRLVAMQRGIFLDQNT